MTRVWTGMDEIEKLLGRLPNRAAQRLQNAGAANHRDHRREVIESSDFSPEGKRLIKFVVRTNPSPSGPRRTVNRIDEVVGETYSTWKGPDVDDPREGAAARIEKDVGPSMIRPRNGRFLLIPQGDFLTPTGRPRRERKGGVMAAVDLSELDDTAIIEAGGRKLLIQHLEGGRRARFESGIKGIRGKRLGGRTRVIGVLVRQAKQARPLDFFGSWERLESKRQDRYERLLRDVLEQD